MTILSSGLLIFIYENPYESIFLIKIVVHKGGGLPEGLCSTTYFGKYFIYFGKYLLFFNKLILYLRHRFKIHQ